jgi:hypothetical protein
VLVDLPPEALLGLLFRVPLDQHSEGLADARGHSEEHPQMPATPLVHGAIRRRCGDRSDSCSRKRQPPSSTGAGAGSPCKRASQRADDSTRRLTQLHADGRRPRAERVCAVHAPSRLWTIRSISLIPMKGAIRPPRP